MLFVTEAIERHRAGIRIRIHATLFQFHCHCATLLVMMVWGLLTIQSLAKASIRIILCATWHWLRCHIADRLMIRMWESQAFHALMRVKARSRLQIRMLQHDHKLSYAAIVKLLWWMPNRGKVLMLLFIWVEFKYLNFVYVDICIWLVQDLDRKSVV